MSENFHNIVERAAMEQHKAMLEEYAAKQRETEKRKEKSIEFATKYIVAKLHEETEIH